METIGALIPLLPLAGFLVIGLGNKRLPKKIVGPLASAAVFLSFLCGAAVFLYLLSLPPEQRHLGVKLFDWVVSGHLVTAISFAFDPLSAVMVLVVCGVGFLIHVYSIGYMWHDSGYWRYFAFLNLFSFAMLVLVMADNLLLMFVGWEGVGLCSYLLIGFWFHKKSAADAGKKAFIVNRVGDFGFLLGIFLIFWTFGTLDFGQISKQAPVLLPGGGVLATAITLLLFVGAVGKSAQIPLYVWLPDAMEGPTPVSALIHAATMVTAGVYMVARLSALYLLAPISMTVVAIIGAVTAFYAGTIGLAQNDIKRVLAYSTISQIGYMFLACGVSAFAAGIFHLTTHAYFKALLFLAAGSVIHALSGEQDMRRMGGLKGRLPRTYVVMLVATLAIAGIPPLSGFVSKDEILWQAFSSPFGHWALWLTGVAGAALTALYMFRLLYLTFYGQSRVDPKISAHIHESPPVMLVPLYVLAVLAIIGGFIGWPKALGGGAWFEKFLAPAVAHAGIDLPHGHISHSTEYLLMAVSVMAALMGILIARRWYVKSPEVPKRLAERFRAGYQVVLNKYYVDEIYDFLIVKPIYVISLIFWKIFDVRIIDGLANALAGLMGTLSARFRALHSGYVRNYALAFLAGVVLLVVYVLFR